MFAVLISHISFVGPALYMYDVEAYTEAAKDIIMDLIPPGYTITDCSIRTRNGLIMLSIQKK